MRSETVIKKMENRVGQDNIDASLIADDFWKGFEYALMWVQGKVDAKEILSDYETKIWKRKDGYEKDPNTGEWVSVVELYPESYDTFGKREFLIYIGEDWKERLEARGYDWRLHLKKLGEDEEE